MTEPSRDDLRDRVAELEDTLEELRAELRGPPRGPLGLPRPPTPREVLRFADEAAIPAAIAVLEANIRTLELLQRAVRLADADRPTGEATALSERTTAASRETLSRLDAALADLAAALEDGRLPREPEARGLIEDARRLDEEIRGRIADAEASRRPRSHAGPESEPGEPEPSGVEIDVEAELESIRRELDDGTDGVGAGARNDGESGEDGGEPGNGRSQ